MTSRSRRTGAVVPALVATLLLGAALAGCSADDEAPAPAGSTAAPDALEAPQDTPEEAPGETGEESAREPERPPPGPDDVQYVALGDSYAAAPGVPETDRSDGCFRSSNNYAHVLAESADLYLTDVTCSGATSEEVIAEQVPAISPETDVVTVGTGGNDLGLFLRVLQSCLVPFGDPADATCADVIRDEIQPGTAEIQAKMGEVLDAVVEAAPEAEVYVVGYPALLPEQGTCPDVLPLAEADYPLVGALIRTLSESLRAEAEARGLAYVDVFAASQGHDICSDEPWVNGPQVGADGTVPFHPFAVEQAAVAALIEDMR